MMADDAVLEPEWDEETDPMLEVPESERPTPREIPPYPERIRCLLCDVWRGGPCKYCGGGGWVVPMGPPVGATA